ncbi:hypothetical protein PR003_g25612 [Phytophthora rubi]|uniref:Uncharacterized protein n=1 Tax=Phytophthora rubi TaxID=129364 RepID=A0A6A4CJ27_9STRA|nr:hypothetical protein PR002_g24420 [Phytophthora rubi]KAE8980228.1 hypothetical protein PR001_g24333 [Phytophthora rubi]KAE9289218.1 hypothetical protein PR003_g25612 [Phytophthora rubi]
MRSELVLYSTKNSARILSASLSLLAPLVTDAPSPGATQPLLPTTSPSGDTVQA